MIRALPQFSLTGRISVRSRPCPERTVFSGVDAVEADPAGRAARRGEDTVTSAKYLREPAPCLRRAFLGRADASECDGWLHH